MGKIAENIGRGRFPAPDPAPTSPPSLSAADLTRAALLAYAADEPEEGDERAREVAERIGVEPARVVLLLRTFPVRVAATRHDCSSSPAQPWPETDHLMMAADASRSTRSARAAPPHHPRGMGRRD